MPFTDDEITNWFTYHPPTSEQALVYELIRNHAREFARVLNRVLPEGPDKTDVIRRQLRTLVMTANAAVATAPAVKVSSETLPPNHQTSLYPTVTQVQGDIKTRATPTIDADVDEWLRKQAW